MPSGNVPPPDQHPDEPPFVCIPVNVEWIPILLGALQPLKYPEYWSGTLDENRGARKDFGLLLDQIMRAEDCGMIKCCVEQPSIQKIDPDTGNVVISYDGGATFEPSPNTIQKMIVTPTPPVTSGISATKCDAAQNAQTKIEDWIAHVITAFSVATSILEFATAVASAIVDALLLILTAGELTAAQGLIIPVIGAICSAVWTAGESLFSDYWTSENKELIFCALYCHIGDDGTFTDVQFNAFWHQCQETMPTGIARELFLGFMSSIGKQGINAMTSTGIAADSDCSGCDCGDCPPDTWHLGAYNGSTYVAPPTVISSGTDFRILESVDRGDGQQYIYITSDGDSKCCDFTVETISGTYTAVVLIPCGTSRNNANFVPAGLTPLNDINALGFGDASVFQVKITFSHV